MRALGERVTRKGTRVRIPASPKNFPTREILRTLKRALKAPTRGLASVVSDTKKQFSKKGGVSILFSMRKIEPSLFFWWR